MLKNINHRNYIDIDLDLGSIHLNDSAGYIVNPAHLENIMSPWKDVLLDIETSYRSYYGKNYHSFYCRGSVAKGRAITKISDVDTILVTHTKLSIEDKQFQNNTTLLLQKKYPFVTSIELATIPLSTLTDINLNNKSVYHAAFMFSTQCAFISGEQNIIPTLPLFKPSKETAIKLLMDMDILIPIVIEKIIASNKEKTPSICQWIMKNIIRNAYLLIMPYENVYARDLGLCIQGFCKHYPEYEQDLYQALDLFLNPIHEQKKIINHLITIQSWYTKIAERHYGKYFSIKAYP